MGPFSVAAARWWLAGILMVAGLCLSPSGRERMVIALRRHWLGLFGLGFLGVTVFYTLQNTALVFTTSIDVGLIMNVFPTLAALSGVCLLHEKMTWKAGAGTGLALAGVTLITLGAASGETEAVQSRLFGCFLAVITVLAGSVYMVAGKRFVSEHGPLVVSALTGILGAVAMTPAAFWEGINLPSSPQGWGALFALALGCSVAAYLLWWHAAARLPLSRVGVFLYISPIVSTALGVFALGEPLGIATSAGAVLVLGGLVLVQT